MTLLRAITALFLVTMASTAAAHEFPVERSAVLQVHTSHAELLLVYVEPPGPRTDRLLALYDADRNGKIDGVEERLARRAFLHRAFYGLKFEFDAQSIERTAEIRYKRDERGGISVAILQRFDLSIPTNALALDLSLSSGETIPPIDIIIEPVGKWVIAGAEGERKVSLAPGQKQRVALSRTPTAAEGPAPAWTPPAALED